MESDQRRADPGKHPNAEPPKPAQHRDGRRGCEAMRVTPLPEFRSEQHKVSFFFEKPSVSPEAHDLAGYFSVL